MKHKSWKANKQKNQTEPDPHVKSVPAKPSILFQCGNDNSHPLDFLLTIYLREGTVQQNQMSCNSQTSLTSALQ
jgi:hypothetical protein